MAITLICLDVFFILMKGSLNVVSRFFIRGMCVVALALEASNMSGATFHPLAVDIHRFSYQGFPWQICHYNM